MHAALHLLLAVAVVAGDAVGLRGVWGRCGRVGGVTGLPACLTAISPNPAPPINPTYKPSSTQTNHQTTLFHVLHGYPHPTPPLPPSTTWAASQHPP